MNDTRAKLETLFRRLTDPSVSDLDALADFVWFCKLRLGVKDVQEALGAPAAGGTDTVGHPVDKPPVDDGPRWPFKKKHAGESIAHIARTDPEYLRYALDNFSLHEPLLGHVKAALAAHAP